MLYFRARRRRGVGGERHRDNRREELQDPEARSRGGDDYLGPVTGSLALGRSPGGPEKPHCGQRHDASGLFSFKEHYELLQKKEGKGESAFGSDRKLPTRCYPEQTDNAAEKLHSMRFERGPIVELSEYWDDMPQKRTPTFRHLPLEHAGLASHVNECVLTRAHDRTMPLRLRMFARGNQSKKGFISKDGEGKEPAESWEYPK